MAAHPVALRALAHFDALFPENDGAFQESEVQPRVEVPGLLSENSENQFIRQTDRDRRKRLGQFFTPAPLARLMAAWIGEIGPDVILDPAVGPGMLLAAAHHRSPDAKLIGIDFDADALAIAKNRLGNAVVLENAEFLGHPIDYKVDAVILNPPYIRHHSTEIASEILNRIELEARTKISGLGNIYCYFILKSLALLRPGGRAALLVPAEWANANYGSSLKQYFLETGCLKKVVYFTHEGLPFTDNLSTACLLLAERIEDHQAVSTYYVKGEAEIADLASLETPSPNIVRRAFPMGVLAAEKKWDALLSGGRQHQKSGAIRLGEKGKTRRGIATGDNGFFMLSRSQAKRYALPSSALKHCVSKAVQAPRYIFEREDFSSLIADDKPVFLFDPVDSADPAIAAYLQQGVANGVAERYLTRTKPVWYRAENRDPAPIWAGVFGRGRLRFVRNRSGVRNLTAFHGLYPERNDPHFVDALTCCLNSDVIAEAVARQQRVYGGGLLKLEPRDILDIEIPDLDAVDPSLLDLLAAELAEMDRAGSPTERANRLVEQAFDQAASRAIRLL